MNLKITHAVRPLPLWLALLLVAACGSEPPQQATHDDLTSGAEEVAVTEPAPEGPPLSHIDETHSIVLRLDLERVRASAVSSDIASLVRSYPTWRDLLGSSGLDPVRDFDQVLVGAAGALNAQAVMLIRHHLTEAEVREAVLNMAVGRGERPSWREVEGFDVVDWPAEIEPARVVVLTADHELVVTTHEQLEATLAVARDHRARREGEEIVEPQLQLREGTIATITAGELSGAIQSRLRIPPPRSFELELRDDLEEPGRMVLNARGTFDDANGAEEARSYLVQQRDLYAGQMLVRAVGLDRPLREAEITAEDESVALAASFTEDEVQRVLGLLALGQQLGGS